MIYWQKNSQNFSSQETQTDATHNTHILILQYSRALSIQHITFYPLYTDIMKSFTSGEILTIRQIVSDITKQGTDKLSTK